ncbi:MAG: flagellar motor switch protein FliG [Phycisphaerae bacterium]|nr:flagellar motor switch protein FliG [Phycisphaerae bacterium]MCZ2399947.1 flagellar motor switch protein FliG [Phycisphaerae bacterium]
MATVARGSVKGKDEPDPNVPSGLRKAAILLLALRPENAAKVLRKLPREHVELVTREIADLENVSSELRAKTIREFYHTVLARQYMDAGGLAAARNLLEKVLPADDAKRIAGRLEHQMNSQPFGFLHKTETENLLMFLAGEHPQTIALVLSHLPAAMASEILVGLPPQRQTEVITRVANMDQTSPDVIREVEIGLESRLAGMVNERFERTGGVKSVAEILNLAGRATEKAILDGLAQDNPDLVEEIRRLMFVFEDVLMVDDRGIQAVLKEIENDELALALRTASDELKQKIFGNMSERAAALIKEEMEFMGPVRISDVEAAQQRIVDVVRRLEDAGELIIQGKGSEKELIV